MCECVLQVLFICAEVLLAGGPSGRGFINYRAN